MEIVSSKTNMKLQSATELKLRIDQVSDSTERKRLRKVAQESNAKDIQATFKSNCKVALPKINQICSKVV